MTYSIIARCHRTGRLGIGTTTTSLACGRRNESVRPNVGISKSQAMYVRAHDPRALNLLALGFTPSAVMRVVEEHDDNFDYRQTGIIDREGNAVAHTGANCGKWAGHKVGPYYAAFGNWLSGPAVVDGLVDGFLAETDLPLEDRLLLALEGGRKAGGQKTEKNRKAERSAWLRVVDRQDYPEIDLRIDMHTNTVAELRLLLQEFRLYQAYYRERCRNPQEAITEEAFVAQLAASTREPCSSAH